MKSRLQPASKRFRMFPNAFLILPSLTHKGEAIVYFPIGSKTISDKDKAALTDLAHTAANLTGYLVEVKGFADSSGSPAMNQRLSKDRAQEVIAFLIQNCNIPVRRIVAPGAWAKRTRQRPTRPRKGGLQIGA